jgi:hypothetical protein
LRNRQNRLHALDRETTGYEPLPKRQQVTSPSNSTVRASGMGPLSSQEENLANFDYFYLKVQARFKMGPLLSQEENVENF